MGIGLYLTRDIINKQHGYIKVASDENGSTFSIFLKRLKSNKLRGIIMQETHWILCPVCGGKLVIDYERIQF